MATSTYTKAEVDLRIDNRAKLEAKIVAANYQKSPLGFPSLTELDAFIAANVNIPDDYRLVEVASENKKYYFLSSATTPYTGYAFYKDTNIIATTFDRNNNSDAFTGTAIADFTDTTLEEQSSIINEHHNPSFSFMDEDIDTVFFNNTGVSTFTVESCKFGGQQVKINTPDTARGAIKLPFNYTANEFYTLAFIYKVNTGSISPIISPTILGQNPNNTQAGTSRVIDLSDGYKLYLHEGLQYSSTESVSGGFYIDFNNTSGGSAAEVEIIQPSIFNSTVFKGKFPFSFGNNFKTIETLIDTINSDISTTNDNVTTNVKKLTETLEPVLTDVLISNTNETSDTTTLMDLFDVEAGKEYKIVATSNETIGVNGISYYNQAGNTVYHNHAQGEDFANGVTYQFVASLSETIRWRIWEIGLDVNFVISEVKYQSAKVNIAVESSNTVNELVEEYNFVELKSLQMTTDTTQESIAISEYQGKDVEVYFKAPYTGTFTIYSKDNPYVTLTVVKSITNTDFSGGISFIISIPNDAHELTIRTHEPSPFVLIDEFSIKDIRIKEKYLTGGGFWINRIGGYYGNSITAHCNGNYQQPYSDFTKWAVRASDDLKLSKFYVRGIGGQRYTFIDAINSNGGSVAFVDADGNLVSRDDNYHYDNYLGNVTVPAGTTPIRGAYSSWLRITTMFPAAIKDTLDFIFIMGGTNDAEDLTDAVWVPNDTTDTEWTASTEYNIHSGDFNIDSLAGGLASTIMKFQVWMPQALIIIATPLSGRGVDNSGDIYNYTLITKEYNIAQKIKEQAGKLSIPLVDVYQESGINGWNRVKYLTDGVHNFNQDGQDMLGRTVSGGISRFAPINR